MGLEEEEEKAPAGTAKPGTDGSTEQDPLGTAGETAHTEGSLSAPPGRAQLVCCTEDLDRDTFKIVRHHMEFIGCKEFLRPYKKSLRKLYLPQHVPREKRLRYTRESLTLLGDHISMFLQQHCKPAEVSHWKQMLWTYVSLFSEMDARQLHRLYRYTKNNQTDKFLRLYCHLESADSAPVSTEELRMLYDAWGLGRDASDAQGHPARGQGHHNRSHKAAPSRAVPERF